MHFLLGRKTDIMAYKLSNKELTKMIKTVKFRAILVPLALALLLSSCSNNEQRVFSGSGVFDNQKDKIYSKSIFVSDGDYDIFKSINSQIKIKSCGFEDFNLRRNWGMIDRDLDMMVRGYNSRMDNNDDVIGAQSRKVLNRYLENITYSMVAEDAEEKDKLFNKLYEWASMKSLSQTRRCYSNIEPHHLCGEDWGDVDGQDLDPNKDSIVSIEIVMALNYVYNLFFSDYRVGGEEHKVIKLWFESFHQRVKPVRAMYFGNSFGWSFMNISIMNQNGEDTKYLIEEVVSGLDNLMNKDGSMEDRTTRGNRALWYHHTAIAEAFILMNIAKINGISLPVDFEIKLLKAVELFHDAFLDHSVIEPWAKQRYHSQASNGKQVFNDTLKWTSYYASWFYLMPKYYPEHRTSIWLKNELQSDAKSLMVNTVTGLNLSCINKVLTEAKEL